MENRVSCSAGRAKLVDPNTYGINSSDNISVPLEDLNISVILTSFRKGRTVLTSDDNGKTKQNIAKIDVNFIEGSNVGGKKVLTTKYTDLTTVFDKDSINDETLGITAIDIEFNSSYVPMIAIHFVDVRGSSIFQNEENILNNTGNKYTTFFQLPYPMFELEIKGFYGLPVKYCLHMTKFNSKFNSKTGNFEITANFIGYTFALMADMLLGYLRAIPYTTIGGERLTQYRTDTKREILTLDELAKKISEINKGLKKEGEDNPAAQQIGVIENGLVYINNLKARITTLGNELEKPATDKNSYDFILIKHVTDFNSVQKTSIDSSYIENVKTDIQAYNAIAEKNYQLTEADFTNIKTETNTNGGKLYKKITKGMLSSTDANVIADLKLKLGSKDDTQLTDTKKKLLDYINKNHNAIKDAEEIDVFDMTLLNTKLGDLTRKLGTNLENSQKTLADDFANTVRSILGFEPTVRHIVEMFTASIEVFVETIFQVSIAAEQNTERTAELEQIFSSTDENNSDIHKAYLEEKVFFPWPDYRKKEETQDSIVSNSAGSGSTENGSIYVEKYLGEKGVLSNPEKVNEVVFIEELLQAFRKSYKSQQETINNADVEESTWFPTNPFDSYLFSDLEPYARYEMLNANDIARMMVIRFMTFMGYSYNPALLSEEDVAALAQIEVDAILRGVKDIKLKKSITDASKSIDTFKNVKGTINGVEREVVKNESGKINYTYIFKDIEWKLIPINKDFNNATWSEKESELITKRDSDETIFFTNYSSANDDANDKQFFKKDDGGTYIKIMSKIEEPKTLYTPPATVKTENVISYEKLKQTAVDKTAGFNPFGGGFGVQEFKDMDWGEPSLQGLPLMYVFYKDSNTGLALTRAASKAPQKLKFDPTSPYFLKSGDKVNTAIEVIESDKENAYKSLNEKAYLHLNLGKNRALFNSLINGGDSEITYPYIELNYDGPGVITSPDCDDIEPYSEYTFSLFGSDLYYGQNSKAKIVNENGKTIAGPSLVAEPAKAFLFLHTLPFNFDCIAGEADKKDNPLNKNEIINLFRYSAGIIHTPRLWCAFIGSILWRYSSLDPIIEGGVIVGGGSGSEDPIWTDNREGFYGGVGAGYLNKYEYFPSVLDSYWGGNNIDYADSKLTDTIIKLPIQVKNEFKRMFFEFVNGTGDGVKWKDLADKLEIFNGDDVEFLSYLDGVRNSISNDKFNGNKILNHSKVKKDNIEKFYDIVAPIEKSTLTQDPNDFYLFLQLRDGTSAVKTILNALREEVLIFNSTYKIWGAAQGDKEREPISVDEALFTAYFTKVNEILASKSDETNPVKENEKADLAVFGTTNVDVIKLQLYKTCKNIYDKWLGGAKSINELIFQCGGRSIVDSKLAKKYGGDETKPRMIDSFRFVARSFRDIGDLLYVNPLPINDTLLENTNTSAYDMISNLLSANRFNFTPLPNFINFNDEKVMSSIFKPFNYMDDEIPEGACGPSFVCVYDGQPSKHLDYGRPEKDSEHSSKYPNDGFDLRCKDGGTSFELGAPDDIVTGEGPKEYEEPVSAFVVKYSQQNQNLFKDIDLDQSEYTETDESLRIQDEISQKGSEHNRTVIGQNIYNVYAIRSYTAKVEMMGNAMIQPMMFFQLDNIPMFHGAYLITKVKHSITPHSMSTHFEGTRIRYPQTPLVTSNEVYMDLLNTFVASDATSDSKIGGGSGGGGVKGSFPPIVVTLIDNGAVNGKVVAGKNKTKEIPKITGVNNGKLGVKNENMLIEQAVKPLEEMLTDFVKWMKANGFKGNGGNYVGITSVFRDYDKQVQIKQQYGSAAATPGSSNHGWAIAVDLQFYNKAGGIISNTKNTPASFKFTNNPAIQWIYDNSWKYGWVMPVSLRDGNPLDEHWHMEYHGTAAKCIVENHPTIYGYTIKVDKNAKQEASVKNPLTPEGKEAVYTNCDYKYVKKSGDGGEGGGGTAAFGCKSPNYSFPFQNPLPPANTLTYSEAIKILKKLPSSTGKAVFAILWAEASKNSDRTAFVSAGGFNYSGVQTDGGKWGAPGIIGQYCRVDSGGKKRAFAIFESNDTFLTFMADRIKSKGFNGDNGDAWVKTYINSWWSPAEKASYTKGTEKYNAKLAIYNSAMKRWDKG